MELQSYEAQCSEKIMEGRESSRAYYSDNNCSIKMEAWRVGLSEEREREREPGESPAEVSVYLA